MHPFYYRLKEISVFCVPNIVADYLSVAHWRKCVQDNGKDDKSKKCLRDSDFVFFTLTRCPCPSGVLYFLVIFTPRWFGKQPKGCCSIENLYVAFECT